MNNGQLEVNFGFLLSQGGDYGGGGQHQDFVMVPTAKCGLIIGKGGETIKNINQVRQTTSS